MRLHVPAGLASFALILTVASSTPQSPGDGDATAFGIAIDSGEMMVADLAIGKKPNDAVMNYVTDLREDHKEHLSALMSESRKANVMASKGAFVDTLRNNAMDMHHQLLAKTGKDFEKAFLDAMVAGHTDALRFLNTRIMTQELSSGVKKEMDHLKRIIEEHLNKAKTLRDG